MTDKLPESAFIAAAKASAEIYGEDLSFLEMNTESRARIVAVLAIIGSSKGLKSVQVARKLGFSGSCWTWAERVSRAKAAKWFKYEDVEKVINAIGASHKIDLRVNDNDVNDRKPIPDESEYKSGATFVPRRRLSMGCIFIPATAKPRNVTSSFCGDPPPGRREMIASMDSRGYRAGNDDGDTTFARELRRRKAAQRSKDQSAN